jgi:hypothetical protein
MYGRKPRDFQRGRLSESIISYSFSGYGRQNLTISNINQGGGVVLICAYACFAGAHGSLWSLPPMTLL